MVSRYSRIVTLNNNNDIFLNTLRSNYYKIKEYLEKHTLFNINSYKKDDIYENTLLHISIKNKNYSITKLLLEEYNADPYKKNAFNESPFLIAIKNSDVVIIKLLNDTLMQSYVNKNNKLDANNKLLTNSNKKLKSDYDSIKNSNKRLRDEIDDDEYSYKGKYKKIKTSYDTLKTDHVKVKTKVIKIEEANKNMMTLLRKNKD
jgi:ankyrin repeat protein